MNTGFSMVSGLTGLLAAPSVEDLLAIEEAGLIRLLGGGLLGFGASEFTVANSRTKTLRKWSVEIFVADFVWVSAPAAVIAAGWMPPSGEIVVHKREMAGSIKDLWPVISDHELYARLAPNQTAR